MSQNLKLFVNYRRADQALFVETLRTHFMYRYGRENVFMDFDSIPPFTHFADFIREQVRAVDALVMIIGPRWLELLQQKAAANEPDYVLIELEEATQNGKVIAPILIMDAPLPDKRQLPGFLQPIFDTVNIPSLRSGLDTLNNIDRLTTGLENEITKQGKSRSIQQPTPAAETTFNIHEAQGYFYEAQRAGDLPAALVWLEKIRHSGKTIPGFFKIDEYQQAIQDQIKQQEEERRRLEVADYLYGFIRQMNRYKQPAAVIREAFNELWAVYPEYDPAGIAPFTEFAERADKLLQVKKPTLPQNATPYPPQRQWQNIEDFAAAVRQIIGEPFEWCEVPAGKFLYGDDKQTLELPGFYIAKYLITYAQFQVFIEAKDGFFDPRWWAGLAADADDKEQPGDQKWKIANHPRERVSWYDAVAFCRWLSYQLGSEYAIDKVTDWMFRLPTETEWEKAARGTGGRVYPWGDTFDQSKCNTAESGIKTTTPVDKYPNGASPYGVLDMSGNLWEWCLTGYDSGQSDYITNIVNRVLRGGSWHDYGDFSRAACRLSDFPLARFFPFGFRVCSVHPPSP